MSTLPFADGRVLLHKAAIARIELNVPEKRNALNRAMWEALIGICDLIAADDTIRVVLLTAARGEGKTAFSAGADISEFEAVYASEETTRAYNGLVRTAQARIRALPRPVIAVISGACVGGGCGLALATDLRFADTTVRMGITPTKLGLAYSPEDTMQLLEKVGPAKAKDLLFSARLMDGTEALECGLIDRLLAPGDLDAAVTDYAETLARLSAGSIRAAKTIINGLTDPGHPDMDALRAIFEATFSSADFDEGRAAFLERRAPKFA